MPNEIGLLRDQQRRIHAPKNRAKTMPFVYGFAVALSEMGRDSPKMCPRPA
jgi:hypothetical protein